MGTGLVANCSNCGYEREFYLGIGFSYSSLENVLDSIKGKQRGVIEEILEHHDIVSTDFYRALYECKKCESLSDRLFVNIIYDGDKEYTSRYKCSRCKNELVLVEDDIEISTYPCPKCKKKTLIEGISFLWD